MRVQHGKKLCRELKNGQTYIHDVSPAHSGWMWTQK